MYTVGEVLARARAASAEPAKYRLGGGKTSPGGDSPLDELGSCDCSAFVCWCLGIPKVAPFDWMLAVNGGWYNTDGIAWDALAERTGYFSETFEPLPGDLVVYPGRWMARSLVARDPGRAPGQRGPQPAVGHVGILTTAWEVESPRVIHCSAGNYRALGTAVAETGSEAFYRAPLRLFARCEALRRS